MSLPNKFRTQEVRSFRTSELTCLGYKEQGAMITKSVEFVPLNLS